MKRLLRSRPSLGRRRNSGLSSEGWPKLTPGANTVEVHSGSHGVSWVVKGPEAISGCWNTESVDANSVDAMAILKRPCVEVHPDTWQRPEAANMLKVEVVYLELKVSEC